MGELLLTLWRSMAAKGQILRGGLSMLRCMLSLPGYLRRIVVSLRRIAIALERIADAMSLEK